MKIEIITNGVSEIRDMTKEEEALAIKKKNEFQAQLAMEQAEAEAKATARQAVLDKLGLTPEELAALL